MPPKEEAQRETKQPSKQGARQGDGLSVENIRLEPLEADGEALEQAKEEEAAYGEARSQAQQEVLKILPTFLQNFWDGLSSDTRIRRPFAWIILWSVIGWLGLILGIVIVNGFGWRGFTLSDAILVALISGASVNVIGLLGTVVAYLFTRSKEHSSFYELVVKTIMDDSRLLKSDRDRQKGS